GSPRDRPHFAFTPFATHFIFLSGKFLSVPRFFHSNPVAVVFVTRPWCSPIPTLSSPCGGGTSASPNFSSPDAPSVAFYSPFSSTGASPPSPPGTPFATRLSAGWPTVLPLLVFPHSKPVFSSFVPLTWIGPAKRFSPTSGGLSYGMGKSPCPVPPISAR